ncbi:DUF2953 domain-containing protein [Metabacillus fastidiosus]|uniref:DUF2953 domain-containing protein n=1 Tax=Metabacillus fastidiosus TaxID=1458 RepID=UPI000A474660|nr:DUF2953 domain-containing protein [Metabacillus fastidiosus]MED4464137.1 DUF2953 domain-containing protein [Metabacillus fastidiosus]
MSWIFWIVCLFIVLMLCILIMRIIVTVDLLHIGDNDHFKIKLRTFFGIIRYTINIPIVKVDEHGPNIVYKKETETGEETKEDEKKKVNKITPDDILTNLKNIKEIVEHVVGLHKIIRKFLKKVKIESFNWHSQIGIGDAAHTAFIVGLAWALKGNVVGLIGNYMHLRTKPEIAITPAFNIVCSKTKLTCIFHFRIGNAMFAGIRLLKYWKAGLPKIRSTVNEPSVNSDHM